MLVAGDHLVRRHARHIAVGERAMLRADAAVEHHLQQHVAQLVRDLHVVVAVHGLGRLAGLLDHVLTQRVVRLRPVPRAAARAAQAGNDLHKVLVRRAAALVHAHARHQHRRAVVVVRLPVQLAQRDGPGRSARLRGVFKEVHRHLVLKQVRKPEFDVRGEVPVVDLGDDLRAVRLYAHLRHRQRRNGAQIFRVHAEGDHRARRAIRQRHAAHHAQRYVLWQRPGQGAHRRVAARLADGVAQVCARLRFPDQRIRSQSAQLVKVLAALVQRVERLILDPLLRKHPGRAVARRAQHQRVRLPHRLQRAQGEHLAAVRPQRRYGYDVCMLHVLFPHHVQRFLFRISSECDRTPSVSFADSSLKREPDSF